MRGGLVAGDQATLYELRPGVQITECADYVNFVICGQKNIFLSESNAERLRDGRPDQSFYTSQYAERSKDGRDAHPYPLTHTKFS